MKTLRINNKEYKIKYTLRALFIFEQITNKPFEVKTLLDNYIFFYSMILANNQDNPLEWDDFINALDDNPNLFYEMKDTVEEQQKVASLINRDQEKDGEKN